MRILLVEDDPAQADAVNRTLAPYGHGIHTMGDGTKAVRWLEDNTVDLVILDWQLPGMSGFEVLHWIRARLGHRVAILFLTSKVLEIDIVLALEAGADEYVVKPFRRDELAARVNAVLRRARNNADAANLVEAGQYILDRKERSLLLNGQPIELTPKEFDLVSFMFNNFGKILSRDLIAKTAWGRELEPASRTLDTHIYRIRQKLALSPENGLRLTAVYTHGYRLDVVVPGSDKDAPAV